MAAAQVRDFLLYGNIKNSVNFPDCELPYAGKKRICVIHKNVARVVGRITGALAEKGLNIDNMQNRSRGDYAYTLIDVDQDDVGGLQELLQNQEAIIKVRVIT
jgi:D-3-phosphoglycerate dehydrogenase